MSKEEIKQKIHQLVEEMEDESALQMLYEEAVEYKTSGTEENKEPTEEQWALIEKARNEIKQGQYHTYDEVKEHFAKWLTK
jgi:predicted transcriptional regulator